MHAALLHLALLTVTAAPEAPDEAYVRILQSTGAVDGPAEGGIGAPRWERVRLELRVENRLQVEVGDLELEIALVSAGGEHREGGAIPGWTFRETFSQELVQERGEAYLRIVRELPARRTSPPADEIAYRVRILGFRMLPPDLETAIRLLGSAKKSDQRAALRSYEPPLAGTTAEVTAIGDELALALAAAPPTPNASDALRLMFAIRAMGSFGDPRHVTALLELPERLNRTQWGTAVLELAERMAAASERDEPRLRVLPSWAREASAILPIRAEGALDDAVEAAISTMGDTAVPVLLLQSHVAPLPTVRARARRMLHALRRSTVRSQLALRDRASRLLVIEVLARVGSAEHVPVLAELLRSRDRELRTSAARALTRMGAPAVEPLVATLGTRNDEAVRETLVSLAGTVAREVQRVAAQYGVRAKDGEPASELVARLRTHLADTQKARVASDLERALELGREGSYTAAFSGLDVVFEQDPDVYMARAADISALYFARARRLYERGDYDATISTARTGLSIDESAEARALVRDAQLALARGFLELGDLDRATEVLGQFGVGADDPEARALSGRILGRRAAAASSQGDYRRARGLIDRALALRPDDPDIRLADRKLLLSENLAVVITLSLLVPAGLLALAVFVRRRFESARVRRLAHAIDRGNIP